MIDLSPLKHDQQEIMSVLGLERAGNGLPCPFHGGSDSLSLKKFDDGWRFRCYGCRRQGDIITAIALLQHKTEAAVITEMRSSGRYERMREELAKRALPKPPGPRYITVPIPDKKRIARFIAAACEELAGSWDYVAQFGRGVTPEVAARYGVGFLRRIQFKGYRVPYENVWSFPISSEDGEVHAIKLHLETIPEGEKGKSRWAPFGTVPEDKPRHAFLTWWPHPAWFDRTKPIVIEPGEHKALTAIARGFQSTCHTQGESMRWKVEDCKLFAGRDVLLGYDDDDDKVHKKDGLLTNTGHEFLDASIKALYPYANSIKVIHLGKLADYRG